MIKSPLVRRVIKNSGYLFSASGISAALSIIQSILVARMLGAYGFGVLGTMIVFTNILNNLASFRMSELVIKYVGHYTEAGDRDRAAAVFKGAALAEMGASIVAFILIFLLAPLGAQLFAKDPSAAPLFTLYGLIVIANLIAESSTGLLQIFDRFRHMAIFGVASSVFTLAVIAGVYFTGVYDTGGGFTGVILAYIGGKTIGALGLTVAALREATRRWGRGWWKISLKLLRPQSRELTRFAINTNLSGSLSLITKDSELLWISFFRNPLEAGYYRLAFGLANLAQMPVQPLPQATYPELSREVARRNWANVRHVLRQGSYLAGGYTLAAALGLLLFGKQIITIFYKPEFLPAYPALLILLAGLLVANTFYWNRIALLSVGLPGYPTRVNLGLAIAKIAGILLLVPKYGYIASAALFAGSYIVGVSLCVLKFRAEINHLERAPVPVQTDQVPGDFYEGTVVRGREQQRPGS